MSRYPEEIRAAAIKCIACNAPVAETIEGEFVCVECGESPVTDRTETDRGVVKSERRAAWID